MMKLKYEFVTNEVIEVEVPDNIRKVSVEIDRVTYNSNRQETSRHTSLNVLWDKGTQIADENSNSYST